jgi:uncharacterized protein
MTSRLSWLTILALTIPGVNAAATASTTVTLPEDIQTALRDQYGPEVRYVAARADLNGDLQPEYVVYVVGPTACETGGCPTQIYTLEEGRHRPISVISPTNPPIGLATGGMAGWRNLVVHVRGGGAKSAAVELMSNGMIYPYNPTVRGPLVKDAKPGEEVKVVISEFGSFANATPLSPVHADSTKRAAGATTPITQHPVTATKPSFDCANARSSIERLVCTDAELASLDRGLGTAYDDAMRKWPDAEKATQRSAQQAWIARRDACAKHEDTRSCVEASYRQRLVEVQIKGGQLVAPKAVGYVCKGREDEPFTVAFYNQTDPVSAVVTLGDRQSIAFGLPAPSGTRYRGADVEFWEHQGEATVKWFGTTLACRAR